MTAERVRPSSLSSYERAVRPRRLYSCPNCGEQWVRERLDRCPQCGAALLTERQREIIRWVAMGATDAEIAQALSIQRSTVRAHLGSMRRKTGARNRIQLAIAALAVGLVSGEEMARALSDVGLRQVVFRSETTASSTDEVLRQIETLQTEVAELWSALDRMAATERAG